MDDETNAHIELENFWPYQVVVLADQISRHTLGVVREQSGLNLSQWRVLAAVADKPGCSAAQVTTVTPMDKTIVSRAVASLIKTGLIQKSPTKLDKRSHALTATRTGLEVYEKISKELNRKLIFNNHDSISHDNFLKLVKSYSSQMMKINAQDTEP